MTCTEQGEPYEEAYSSPGVPRPQYAELFEALRREDLGRLGRKVADDLERRGVTFGAGEDPDTFAVDPVPRVITAAEWAGLEAGLVQRVRALNRFVTDVYGERSIVEAGVVPARVVDSAQHHEPDMRGAPIPPGGAIAVAGLDVVRAQDGAFFVLEDNVRTPSGLAYAVAAREAVETHLPAAEDHVPLDGAFEALGRALSAASPDGRPDPAVVLLSDGPANSAWWEHRTIASAIGIPIVGLGDLSVRGDRLVAAIDGVSLPVDVVYRRTDEERLVDERGRPTPVGEALLAPIRAGRLSVVNAFGAGVADDKLTHAYVEAMIRFYLGEEPLVRSVPTYDLGDDRVRDALLERIGEIVVKPRSESGGTGVFVGPHARPEDRDAMVRRVREAPGEFVAQETISLSRHPTVVGDALEPRHVDLRAFVFLAGERATALPGGLTRVALEEGSLVVNSSQRGGGKDTRVLP